MAYIAPAIQTDELQASQMPEPGAWALQQQVTRAVVVETIPVYEHVGGFQFPDVPWHSGWHEPQKNDNVFQTAPMLQSPDVQYAPAAYLGQTRRAAHPGERYAQTGVHRALRAPAINEGYT